MWAGNRLSVNGQIINIPAAQATSNVNSGSVDPIQRYQSTVIQHVGGRNKLADAAYAYRTFGSVVVVTEEDDEERAFEQMDPIFVQSFLRFEAEVAPSFDETDRALIKDLPIFLNFEMQYLQPRTVDAVIAFSRMYRDKNDDIISSSIRELINLLSDYDFIVLNDAWSVGLAIRQYAEQHPGFLRCCLIP